MRAEDVINKLKQRQLEMGMGALKNPGDKSSFTFGHACGVQAGIEFALTDIVNIIKEEKEGDKDL